MPMRATLALLLLATALPLAAQEAPPEHTFSTNVKVVNVLATAREKNGNIVRDLTQDDFQLSEDGRPQVVRYFSQETDLPLTIGLLVDTSISQRNVLAEERAASYTFLNNMLRAEKARKNVTGAAPEPDRAFIIQFDVEVQTLQEVTSSRMALEAALDQLTPPSADRIWRGSSSGRQADGDDSRPMSSGTGNANSSDRLGRLKSGSGTLLYDAVHLATDEVMRSLEGRKALIVLSDGEDYYSKLSLDDAIESAQRADTVVYTILFREDDRGRSRMAGSMLGGGQGRRMLEAIANATGGRAFEVTRGLSIRQIYALIEEELRNQYSLGYSSDRPARSAAASNDKSNYRKISLTTRRKNVVVHARDGYYADKQTR